MMTDEFVNEFKIKIKDIKERKELLKVGFGVISSVKDEHLSQCIEIMLVAAGVDEPDAKAQASADKHPVKLHFYAQSVWNSLWRHGFPSGKMTECLQKMDAFVEKGTSYEEQGIALISKISQQLLVTSINVQKELLPGDLSQITLPSENTNDPEKLRRVSQDLWRSLQSGNISPDKLQSCLEDLAVLAELSKIQKLKAVPANKLG